MSSTRKVILALAAATALAASVRAAPEIRAYDFGPPDSDVWEGFTGVGAEPYAEATGLGWKPGTKLTPFKQPGPHPGFVGGLQDPLVADGVHADSTRPAEFRVDLPNGDYAVWVLSSFYRRSFCNALWGLHQICAEDAPVWELQVDKTNFFDIYFRDAEHTIDSEFYREGVWQRYLKPWLDDWKPFAVTVSDGCMDLAFTAYRDRIHALVIAPVALKGAAADRISAVSQARQEWFGARWQEEAPGETVTPARLTDQDRARGYVVFARHWMQEVFPATQPGADELNPTLKLMLTPGEREPVTFCVRALRDLKDIQVTPSDLVAADGARIPKANIAYWSVRCEARPYPGGTYRVAPVALEQRPGLGLDANLTRTFFLKLRAPEDAPAGIYGGTVTFRAADAPVATIPIKVRVLPFKLAYPDRIDFCVEMGSLARFLRPALNDPEIKTMHWDWVRRYLYALREHNMTTLHLNAMPAVTVQDDKVALDFDGGGLEYYNLNRLMEIYREAGFTGPNVIYQGFMSLYAWGLRMHPAYCKLADFESERGQDLLRQAARQVVAQVKSKGWPEFILYATGEPTNFPQGIEKAVAVFKALGDVPGATRAMSSINERDHAVFPYLDVVLFGSPSQNNMGAKIKAQGKKLIAYNSGITRLSYGFYVWRIDAVGRTQEHFQSTIQDRPFNDFLGTSSCWSYTHMAYGPEGPRPCPRLEHQAEGIDDYRYILTLEQLVRQAEQKGGDAATAAAATRELLARIRRNVPEDMRVFHQRGGHWEPGVYDRLRSRVASEIMALQEAVQ